MVKKAAQATPNHLLRAARKERGWTQQQVAERIGAPLSLNISRWENGTAFPSAYYLEKLSLLFGKSLGELGLSQQSSQTLHESAKRMWMLPYPRNLFFLGREEELAHLHNLLQSGQAMAPSQPQAISGLGGVGKTQLALEYAYRNCDNYQAIFWTRADTRDALVAGFLQIAQTLSLPEHEERDQTIVVAAVKGWLSQQNNWLFILDNADELALVPEFLPSPMQGHLLLTTRAQALGRLANRIEVETLDTETSALLLLRRSGLLSLDAPLARARRADQQAALQLSRELGGLPLALDQAGAYLEETRCGLRQYLELYLSHRANLLRQRGGVVQDHPDSVTATWSLSFACVEQRNAAAADLLRCCALLHPDAIPEELFLQGAAHLGSALAAFGSDPLAFNQALSVIQNYSLLSRSSQEHTLSIHRLVQAVLQDAMTKEELEQWRERARSALNAAFPLIKQHGWGQWEHCARLLPHVLTCVAVPQKQSLELACLLVKTADYLFQRAQYEQAEPFYQQALCIREQLLGGEHQEVALLLNALGELSREQGRYEQAEPLYQHALHLWEQMPDQDLDEIASLCNNLAILYIAQGKYEQAEPLLQRALHLDEQTRGPENPEIASPLNNLAVLYMEQGKYSQAEPLLQRALRLDEQALGREHPGIAFPLANLAEVYRLQGFYERAEPLYQRALHIREQTIGGEHPEIAFPLNGLASLYREQGHYEQAEPLYQRALAIRQEIRGTHHVETAESLHEFARLYELRNQPEQALPLYQQALRIRERRLGPEHPYTVETRKRCMYLLQISGNSVSEEKKL